MPRKIGFSIYLEVYPGSDISPDAWEFMQAMQKYQDQHQRRYPSYREILGVLKSLGYAKAPPTGFSPPWFQGGTEGVLKELTATPPSPPETRGEIQNPTITASDR